MIKVEIDKVSIIEKDNMSIVNFIQRFYSDQYSDIGLKRLYLIKSKDGYKIIGEEWREEGSFYVNKNQQKVMLDGR